MLFAAAYGLLMSAVSGREDFIVGTPVSGRTLADTKKICGPFINTLPLRLRPEKGKTVSEYLGGLHDTVVGLLDHQKMPLEEMISMLHLPVSYTHLDVYKRQESGVFHEGDRCQ